MLATDLHIRIFRHQFKGQGFGCHRCLLESKLTNGSFLLILAAIWRNSLYGVRFNDVQMIHKNYANQFVRKTKISQNRVLLAALQYFELSSTLGIELLPDQSLPSSAPTKLFEDQRRWSSHLLSPRSKPSAQWFLHRYCTSILQPLAPLPNSTPLPGPAQPYLKGLRGLWRMPHFQLI